MQFPDTDWSIDFSIQIRHDIPNRRITESYKSYSMINRFLSSDVTFLSSLLIHFHSLQASFSKVLDYHHKLEAQYNYNSWTISLITILPTVYIYRV